MTKINVGGWRDDANGPIKVLSGPLTRPRVYYEAPPPEHLLFEMACLLTWAYATTAVPALLKTGVVRLWFVTLHPFNDGSEQMARAICNLFLGVWVAEVFRQG